LLERADHLAHDLLRSEQIALGRRITARRMTGPWGDLAAGQDGVPPARIDDRELPPRFGPRVVPAVRVLGVDAAHDLFDVDTLLEKLEGPRPVRDVDERLRDGRADAALGPEDPVSDREDPRLHGAADLLGSGIVGDNREACGG